ncbi:MAG: 2-oxoacid:acceptor oxidoreductase family protein [Methanocellales archaeon]
MARKEVRFAGVGGQGILLMAVLYARAASKKGYYVTNLPEYGAEKRGSLSTSDVVISHQEIGFPKCLRPSMLVIMHQKGYDANLVFIEKAKKLLLDSDMVQVKVKGLLIPATRIAHSVGSKMTANIVMLGALAAVDETIDLASLLEAIDETLPSASIAINLKALNAGYGFMIKSKR